MDLGTGLLSPSLWIIQHSLKEFRINQQSPKDKKEFGGIIRDPAISPTEFQLI